MKLPPGIVSIRRYIDGKPEGYRWADEDESEEPLQTDSGDEPLCEVSHDEVMEALLQAITRAGSAWKLADRLGISRSAITRQIRGQRPISRRVASELGFVCQHKNGATITYWRKPTKEGDK